MILNRIEYRCNKCGKLTFTTDDFGEYMGDEDICVKCYQKDPSQFFVCPNFFNNKYGCISPYKGVMTPEFAKEKSFSIKTCENCGNVGCHAPNQNVCVELCIGCRKYKCLDCIYRIPTHHFPCAKCQRKIWFCSGEICKDPQCENRIHCNECRDSTTLNKEQFTGIEKYID